MHVTEEWPEGYLELADALTRRGSVDLRAYKRRQMVRRLTGYLRRVGVDNFAALAELIGRDAAAFEQLHDFLTINVSEFFRNPDQYQHLEQEVLPKLLERFGRLKVWSAGCSVGAEPYTVAILLDELDPHGDHEILGTDVDTGVLEMAKRGRFSGKFLREMTPQRKERYFNRVGEDEWEIVERVRRRITFRAHNLLDTVYPDGQHLILCRNVIIYFNDEAKQHVFHSLASSLVPDGYLMLGATESILNPRQFGLRATGAFFYRREVQHECVG